MSNQDFSEIDVDGDGVADGIAVDSDGDGYAESFLTQDVDGHLDVLSDTDASGVYDTESVDSDGNGITDTTYIDVDEDGQYDAVSMDTDGDGVDDVGYVDNDGDGSFETTVRDLDGDGVFDVGEVDVDGDGTIDQIVVPGETLVLDDQGHVVDIVPDGTGTDGGEVPEEPSVEPGREWDDGWEEGNVDLVPSDTEDDSETEDPPVVDDAGERADDATLWFEQSENGFCMPASVAQIVAEYGDQGVSEADFVQRAEEMGYLTYDDTEGWSGMTAQQGAELLESFGVDCTLSTGDIDSLDSYLDQGYNAIVTIDSSVVWEGTEAGDADHAVVVSNIEDGIVYLNDPGTPDGQLEQVPLSVFQEAWSASGDTMILTDNPDIDEVGAAAGTGLSGLVQAGAGTIILPIVLTADDLVGWPEGSG